MTYRIGIDIGGTFTDFTVIDTTDGSATVGKCLTTPEAPELGVLAGVADLSVRLPDLLSSTGQIIHATTLVTNVILEGKGAPTGLLTTRGFTDVLEIGRELRYDVYDLFARFPPPLVPRPLRLGVDERIYADGQVLTPLSPGDIEAAATVFREAGVKAVAICFLHAYRNPAHELMAARILGELLPGVAVSMSHEVHPEPKEYERTSTTVLDAYVKPVASAYLDRMERALIERGYAGRLYLMLSDGGTATVETTKRYPIQIVESGPAAGVEAALHYGRLTGTPSFLSFDMGGTTAKLCLIRDGQAARTRSFEVARVHRFKSGSGYPVMVNVYDLLEIGSGGGSIARITDLGLLEVGPDSAGAVPGPACYGRGGTQPTVTDADLVLGYLDPEFFLGGEMGLDAEAARTALAQHIGSVIGMDPVGAAWGIHDVVNEKMASAARVYVAEKGDDPTRLALMAFGGAGPVHAVALARKLGCPRVIVPPFPGVMSSFGLLAAPIAFARSRAVRTLLHEADVAALDRLVAEMRAEAVAVLPEAGDVTYRHTAELCYSGQDYPLEIEVDGPWMDDGAAVRVRAGFERLYERLYGRVNPDAAIELVTLRVQAMLPAPPLRLQPPTGTALPRPRRHRRVSFDGHEGVMVPVYQRDDLGAGADIAGPAIIEERESTTIVGPGDRLTVDAIGCLVVDLRPAGEGAALAHTEASDAA